MSKVLIVEDDLPTLKIYNEAFTKAGIGVREFTSGDIPIAFMKSVDPDVILLDIMLPKMSGTDFLEKFRATPNGKTTPVLALTNLAEEAEVQHPLGGGERK